MTRINLDELDPSGDIQTLADDVGALDPHGDTRRELMRKGAIGASGAVAGAAVFGLLSPMEAMAVATRSQKGPYSRRLALVNRGARRPTSNDVRIGNYALTLEFIEAAFYEAAVGKNYADADINAAAKVLAEHERAHVNALKRVLKSAAVRPPKLNGSAVAALLKDQNTFILSAAAIEPVGTAAYAGAGPYISNLGIVEAALAIHSVEANHAAYTQQICVQKGLSRKSAVPEAFNPAFTFRKTLREVGKLDVIDGNPQP